MICVVVKGPTFAEAMGQIKAAIVDADLIELRLDYFDDRSVEQLKLLKDECEIPVIFTLRSSSQGGSYPHNETNRIEELYALAALKPDYIDLEYDLPRDVILGISTVASETKVILSYHNFTNTPADLHAIYTELKKIPADLYKIAVKADNSIDAMRLLCWVKESRVKDLIAISMGEFGQMTRILGPIVGSRITYASFAPGEESAPGQLSAHELREKYRCHEMNRDTAIYALIGDPVVQSIGGIVHNTVMKTFNLNAVYVLIQVSKELLGEFIQLMKKLPFYGLSVTMPHKEAILDYLDEVDSLAADIGAVNTVVVKDETLFGYNTDAAGALDAIEKEMIVEGKSVIIIGAGGSAKAIVHEACKRGAQVAILNRSEEKAKKLGKRYGCAGYGFENGHEAIARGCDVLINCTPNGMPIDAKLIPEKIYAMDITITPKETLFLKNAKKNGCRQIYGYSMWLEQAAGQYRCWMGNQVDHGAIHNSLMRNSLKLFPK